MDDHQDNRFNEIEPIAPSTEQVRQESTTSQSSEEFNNTFVWMQLNSLEGPVSKLYIFSIIGIFIGPLVYFCCVPSYILNVLIIIFGIVYNGKVKSVVTFGRFNELEMIRINTVKRKVTQIIVFGIIGLVVSLLCLILPYIFAFIFIGS